MNYKLRWEMKMETTHSWADRWAIEHQENGRLKERITELEANNMDAAVAYGKLLKRIEDLHHENEMLKAKLDRVRSDFCVFWKAQGCSCCEDTEASEKYGRRLAESLNIPLFDDNSGVDYYSVCESALEDEKEELKTGQGSDN